MISSGQKTSLLIPSQLPEFIRDDPSYQNFVLFVQAYYEWLEENNNVTDRTKNILNYKDIDKTSAEFLDYFYNDFLSYFPKEILADKAKVTKIAKELYKSKGTISSYKFLFRILYNSDVDFFYTKDAVLRASDGKWYVAKSLKLDSTDLNFLNTNNLKIFGETTKSLATIENSVVAGNKIEIFISDIERLFQSGEFIRIVDSQFQDVLFNGEPLRAKIVGQISKITIDPDNRGLFYQSGDPVVVHGGLNSPTGIGAVAEVGDTTSGLIERISTLNGGYGYRLPPNSVITLTNAPGAIVVVGSLNPAANGVANATFVPVDYIGKKASITIGAADYAFSNIATSNANTSFANAFTYASFTTYPISSVVVNNGGGGITQNPTIVADSLYPTEDDAYEGNLRNLGILAPLQIISAGEGYEVDDVINITGGSGYGAYANVTNVSATGAITEVSFVYPVGETIIHYPLGGLGYKLTGLPTVTITSANVAAANAVITAPGILGDGAQFAASVDRVGAISTITITDPGEDYIATPNVSIKVQDMVVSNVIVTGLPQAGDIVYQGTDVANSTYYAVVDSTDLLTPNGDPYQSLYNLRVYDYTSRPNFSLPIYVDGKEIVMNMSNSYDGINNNYDATGLIVYGDGTAKATASFLNGLVISQGQYLDTSGQPSSFSVLQSEIYNNYTYRITLEKEIAEYRETLLNLLHPSGMKVLGRYALNSNSTYNFAASSLLESGHTLGYYTGNPGSYATMVTDWTNQSNNIINFYGLSGANLQEIIVPGDIVTLTTDDGFKVHSEVVVVNADGANNIIVTDNTWLTFANVAYITANAGSDEINITSLTGSYNIINNGTYSNTAYPLKDIVYAGDKVLVANNTERTVQSVDYVAGVITLTSVLTNAANSLMSVNRTVSTSDVRIDGFDGIVFYPELLTEDGRLLTTEDGKILLIG